MAVILSALSAAECRAQDRTDLLTAIESANSNGKLRKGDFTEERCRKAKAPQKLAGELTFDPAGELTMNYSTPQGDFFVIADGFIRMKNGSVENKFDLSKNKPMKQLADLLISSFSGTLQSFASGNSCTMDVDKGSVSVRVTLKATKKGVKGYSMVIADYDPETLLLMSMYMEEFDGSVTTYMMKH